jgi:hypothetical protein
VNRRTLVTTADTMTAIRPDWKQGGCISQLQVLDHSWQGTEAELIAHAVLVAGDPAALTPAAINNIPIKIVARPAPNTDQGKEPTCFICGNIRTKCRQLHDFEVAHGLPDSHIFETHEEADAHTGKAPHVNLTTLALAATPKINDYEESPARTAAKARARAAVEEARKKSKWTPKPEPNQRRIQEPEPEQETST